MSYASEEEIEKWNYSESLKSKLKVVDKALLLARTNSAESFIQINLQETLPTVNLPKGESRAFGQSIPRTSHVLPQLRTNSQIVDESYQIDSKSEQRVTCPNCFLEMPLKSIRKHMTFSCSSLLADCPEAGCGARCQKSDMKQHLAKDCLVAKKRRSMVANVATRRQEKLSFDPLASDTAAATEARPLSKTDSSSEVESGSETPLRSHLPEQTVECSDCGDTVNVRDLLTHQESICRMRLIYCPNKRLGCGRMIPLSKVFHHLNVQAVDRDRASRGLPSVDSLAQEQTLVPGEASVSVSTSMNSYSEKDECGCVVERRKLILVERSVRRRDLVRCNGCGEEIQLMYLNQHEAEQCSNRRVPCRNACIGCAVMVRLKDRALHESVSQGRQTRSCLFLDGSAVFMNVAEDDVPCPWTAEYWIYRPSAEESAKKYIRDSVRHGLEFIAAYIGEKRVRDRVAAMRQSLNSPVADHPSWASLSKQERGAQKIEAKQRLLTRLQLLVIKYEKSVLASVESWQNFNSSLIGAIAAINELRPRHSSQASQATAPPSCANSLLSDGVKVSLALNPAGERAGLTLAAEEYIATMEALTIRKNSAPIPEQLTSTSTFEGEDCPPQVGSVVEPIELMPASLAAQQPESLFGSRQFSSEDFGDCALLYIPDINVDSSMISTEASTGAKKKSADPDRLPRSFFCRFKKCLRMVIDGAALVRDDPDDATVIDLPPVDTRKKGRAVAGLSAVESAAEASKRLFSETFDQALAIVDHNELYSWSELLEIMCVGQAALASDDARLQRWREELNLIERSKYATNERDEAIKGKSRDAIRREKDKAKAQLRRERRKQMRSEAESNGEIEDEAESKSESVAANPEDDSSDRLLTRLKELYARGVGSGVIASSSCRSKMGSGSRICLEMHVPRKQLLGSAAETSPTDGSSGCTLDQPMYDTRIGVVSIEGAMGVESSCFDVTIPRQKWTHIAFVCTKKPKNRLTCYKDGVLMGHMKSLSFPLPMATLGGCDSLRSFQGCLLDVRYWSKQRSSKEIRASMHRLIELSGVDSANRKELNVRKRHSKKRLAKASDAKSLEVDGKLGTEGGRDGSGDDDDSDDDATSSRTSAEASKSHANHTRKLSSSSPRKVSRNKKKSKANSEILDLSDRGLIAWWAFEDGWKGGGKGGDRVFDLTEHRFKTQVLRTRSDVQFMPLRDGDTATPAISSTAPEESRARHLAASSTQAEEVVDESSDIQRSAIIAPAVSEGNTGKILTRNEQRVLHMVDSAQRKSRKAGYSWIDTECLPCPSEQSDNNYAPVLVPVPSFRLKNICPFELRRFKLAQAGRQLQRQVSCPMGCDASIRKFDLRFHVRYECERRLVTCRFEQCPYKFPAMYRDRHEQYDCEVVLLRQEVIENAMEANKLFPCSLCSDMVRARNMKHHLEQDCPHRSIVCPHSDCRAVIQAHCLDHHLNFQCESAFVKSRLWMIERSRARTHYPRPWGIALCMPVNTILESEVDSELL